jgi:hypothetical protein
MESDPLAHSWKQASLNRLTLYSETRYNDQQKNESTYIGKKRLFLWLQVEKFG